MNRKELVHALAERRGLTRGAAEQVLKATLQTISDGLCEGKRVELRGFGSWKARYYPGYLGRNPKSGSRVSVPAKVLPIFRPAKALVRVVNNGAVEAPEHQVE